MEVFAGERFRYNSMANCIPNAFFGRSPNDWINTELFFGWLANHFAKIVTVRPVVLLVDGHSSHIDLKVSKFCSENGILLYCLPPHASHLLQPLDVGFIRSLKSAWGKECNSYRAKTIGSNVSKETFSEVFKDAWLATVKTSLFVNAFRESGICPLNLSAIDESKFAPSMPHSSRAIVPPPHSSVANKKMAAFENLMKPETVKLFEERFEEGYDIESDELYSIWSKMKKLTISDPPEDPAKDTQTAAPIPTAQQKVSSALDEILTYPNPPAEKKKGKSTSSMPKYLSSQQMIAYLDEKKAAKQREEEEKQQRKEERERKKLEREEIKKLADKEKRKKELAEKQAQQQRRGRRGGRGQRSVRSCQAYEHNFSDSDENHGSSCDVRSRGGEVIENAFSTKPEVITL